MRAALISVDWGTTTLRCALVSDRGEVLQRKVSQQGILKTGGAAFADILHAEIQPWLAQLSGLGPVPVIMSGMIGSRQGWQEVAYVACPGRLEDLTAALAAIETTGGPLDGCDVRIVPGMNIATRDAVDQLPDVMRGEEAQVFGALIGKGQADGVFIAPGTHSKWVVVENRRIVHFETFMTGEIYAALLDATILGKLSAGADYDHDRFVLGAGLAIRASRSGDGPGHLLSLVFSARSRVLLGDMAPSGVRSYLSGLLIGAEVAAGAETSRALFAADARAGRGFILADEPLLARYHTVGELAGFALTTIEDNPAAAAHLAIARGAGLVT